jgi:hypothetical protein
LAKALQQPATGQSNLLRKASNKIDSLDELRERKERDGDKPKRRSSPSRSAHPLDDLGMTSRPQKRAKLDPQVQQPHSQTTAKLLTRLSKPSLCSLALTWLNELNPVNNPAQAHHNDSDSEEDEEDEEEGSKRSVYQRMRDEQSATKLRVVARIQADWVSLLSRVNWHQTRTNACFISC